MFPSDRVLDKSGKPVPHVYCIGDANGKLMLAHAASAQASLFSNFSSRLRCLETPRSSLSVQMPVASCYACVSSLASCGSAQMVIHDHETQPSMSSPSPEPCLQSLQGISAVEHMCGRDHVLNHLSVPAACFTHPEVGRAL